MTFHVLQITLYNPRLPKVKGWEHKSRGNGIFYVTKQTLPKTKQTIIIDRANLPRRQHFKFTTELATKYDIYHIYYWTHLLACYLTPGPKKVYEPLGWQVGFGFNRIKNFLSPRRKIIGTILDKPLKLRLLTADRLIVGGPDLYEEAIKLRSDTILNPWPVNFKIFNPNIEAENLEGEPAIFLPTRLDRRKGITEALAIWREIKRNYPKAKLHLIEWGELVPNLKKTLENDAVWHTFMYPEKYVRVLRGANLVLGQFWQGTIGYVEREAMACRVPIVVYDKYELKTTSNLNKLAIRLLKDQNFRQQYTENNYNYAKKQFDPAKQMSTILKVYEELLSE